MIHIGVGTGDGTVGVFTQQDGVVRPDYGAGTALGGGMAGVTTGAGIMVGITAIGTDTTTAIGMVTIMVGMMVHMAGEVEVTTVQGIEASLILETTEV